MEFSEIEESFLYNIRGFVQWVGLERGAFRSSCQLD